MFQKEQIDFLDGRYVTNEELDKTLNERFDKLSLEHQNNMHVLQDNIHNTIETSNELQGYKMKNEVNESIKRIELLVKDSELNANAKKIDFSTKVLLSVIAVLVGIAINSVFN